MDERIRFVAACHDSHDSFAQLCRSFGISRKTGYKWVARYEARGPRGLEEASRAPCAIPHRTADDVRDVLVAARREHPFWGPKKLRCVVAERHPRLALPAPSTIGALLKREGLIRPRKRRLRVPWSTQPLDPCHDPNALWCIDFKGHFALGDRSRCYPLTVTDAFSRYLLACEAMNEGKEGPVRVALERAFREFGLPERLRSDNGPPFASVGLGGLTGLSVWWVKLGIVPERIEPGHPEQNGRHERMHRTLKLEATQPAAADLGAQQRTFDRWRAQYNEVRPHEALGQRPPASAYALSRRRYPSELGEPTYGPELEVRRVHESGRLKRKGVWVPLGRCLGGEPVGLREVGEAQWQVYYGPLYLGTLDETKREPRLLRAP
ncbi:MAG: integrase core domain-containing protein [Polyangiaceae bacterium]|jgi:putative transposase|nr:integrase core domain-containing protein [Polyangiaceae bacterium]